MDGRSGFHFQSRNGYYLLAHITSKRYEAIWKLCSFYTFFNWISKLEDISSPQFKTNPYVIAWCMIGILLFWKCDASFHPNILDMRIAMIWMLFHNFEVFHPVGSRFDLKFPSDHHPFIIVKESIDSNFLCNHSWVTLTWDSLKWYIWLSIGAW